MRLGITPKLTATTLFFMTLLNVPALAGDQAARWLGIESSTTTEAFNNSVVMARESLLAGTDFSGEYMVDEPDESVIVVPGAFGAVDTWRWVIYGGGAIDIHRDGEYYNLHWAAEYFLTDYFSINFEFGVLGFDQPKSSPGDAVGGNLSMILRWHWLVEENWSLFLDGGAGVILISEEVPERGTNFNFTPQAGVGATFAIGDDGARLMTGMRWHHLSNARIHGADDNPGRDSLMAWVGMSFPWN